MAVEDTTGQKRQRLDAAGSAVTSEAAYKSKLARLLKYASPDTVIDILASM
jgi:hypothetical protein